jgi:hypothetical protein
MTESAGKPSVPCRKWGRELLDSSLFFKIFPRTLTGDSRFG